MYNNYFNKYLKYKQKYLYLRYMTGGVSTELDKEAKNTEAEEVTNVNFIDPRSRKIYNIEISNNGIKVGDENVEVYNFKNIKIFEHNERTFMLYNNNIYMITSKGIIKYYNNIFGHIMIPDNEYKKLSDELIGINKEDNIKEEIRKKIVNRLYSDINKIIIGSESGKLRSFNEDYNNPRLIDTRTHFDHYRPQFEKMK